MIENDELYGRIEALGQAWELDNVPTPADDDYWDGVLTPSPTRQGGTKA